MALDLRAISAPAALPAGFVTVPVREAEALTRWTGVWMATVPEPTRQRCRAVYAQLGVLPTAPWRYYLGLLDGVPVATVKLFYAAGVVSVQHVMTLPEARRRGIGAAIVAQALQEASMRGYRLAVLTATPVGYDHLSAARVPRVRARGQPHLATSQRIDRHRRQEATARLISCRQRSQYTTATSFSVVYIFATLIESRSFGRAHLVRGRCPSETLAEEMRRKG